MMYVVTGQQQLFDQKEYMIISVERSLEMLQSWGKMMQFDTETLELDPHLGQLLTMQFGDIYERDQILVDCTTVDPRHYKQVLEEKFLIVQNGKFDLKWLFNYDIHPLHLWDTMVAEQLLYLGFPNFLIGADRSIIDEYAEWYDYNSWKFDKKLNGGHEVSKEEKREIYFREIPRVAEFMYYHSGASLKALCYRYRGEDMDKSVRGEIQWRGLDTQVIIYACTDVRPLYSIMRAQQKKLASIGMLRAVQVECEFVPVVAYYEWCGAMLDIPLWQDKMKKDFTQLEEAYNALNDFVIEYGDPRFFEQTIQLDLFADPEVKPKPKVLINWQSSKQVIPFLTLLGFDCRGIDKKTKEEKDTIDAKVLEPQKGINDPFLEIYFKYTEAYKVCTTYGQQYINAVNPKTQRIHTEFRQLGTDTGRLACGSQDINTALAKLKGLPTTRPSSKKKREGIAGIQDSKICSYPQLQNLPADELTRQCFKAAPGNKWVSIDYAAQESRLMASMANDTAMIREFLEGSGDMHSLTAKMVYKEELEGVPVSEVKKFSKANHKAGGLDFRQEAKSFEFCFNYAGNDTTLVNQYGFKPEEAKVIYDNYMSGFQGLKDFQYSQKEFVDTHGYILISPVTGHRSWWWDHSYWLKAQSLMTNDFWTEYRNFHKGTGDAVAQRVGRHFKARTKWEKNACNSPLQGTGAIIFKIFNRKFFEWIIENNLFGKVRLCVPAHDEINFECPEERAQEIAQVCQKLMEEAGRPFCTALPMPADISIADFWVH